MFSRTAENLFHKALVEQIESQEQGKYSSTAYAAYDAYIHSQYNQNSSPALSMAFRAAMLQFASASDARRTEIITDFFAAMCSWHHSKASTKPTADGSAAAARPFTPGENVFSWHKNIKEYLKERVARPDNTSLGLRQTALPYLLDNHASIPDHRVNDVLDNFMVRAITVFTKATLRSHPSHPLDRSLYHITFLFFAF